MPDALGLQELVRLFVEGFELLQQAGRLLPRELKLQGARLLNDMTLVASIVPTCQRSVEVKSEICTVMSAMASFFVESMALPGNICNYGVQAYTEDGDELMYALSSIEVAKYCAEGRSIEWITNSIIVENTPEHRRTRAKLLVSRVEIGLRQAIDAHLSSTIGPGWWSSVDERIRKPAERGMRQEADRGIASSSPLDYTFLPQLKEIVVSNWTDFQSIFGDPQRFERAMDDLNAIRRPEAHNREISHAQIKELEAIHGFLASAIVRVNESFAPGYLVENWSSQMSDILKEAAARFPIVATADSRNLAEAREVFALYVTALHQAQERIRSLAAPPGRSALHLRFLQAMDDLVDAAAAMQAAGDSVDVTALKDASTRHDAAYGVLKALVAEHLMIGLG